MYVEFDKKGIWFLTWEMHLDQGHRRKYTFIKGTIGHTLF